jgi:hypothetical protein
MGGPGGVGRPGMPPNSAVGREGLPGLGGLGSLARPGEIPAVSRTEAINQQALASQADRVRGNFNFNNNYDNFFNRNWWSRHPEAWSAAGWDAARVAYSTPTWAVAYGYCGYGNGYGSGSGSGYTEPAYYDYGSNVVYELDHVYVNGDAVATQEEYGQQAARIADTGMQARGTTEGPWLPLGVFAMVQGEQVSRNDLFQLAVNKEGVIRGNYFSALSDTTLPVYGAVDKKTRRAAWTVGDRKQPIFEAGFANLTKSETTMLVHFGKDRAQQWTLVRINQSAEPK